MVGLGEVLGEELLSHSVLEGFAVGGGDTLAFASVIFEEISVTAEGILIKGLGGSSASVSELGALGVDGVAVGALFPAEVTVGVVTEARRGNFICAFSSAVFADGGGVFSVKLAKDATVI